MKSFYKSHLRIYVIILIWAIVGIWSGLNMSISLFPNTAQPIVRMAVGYGGMSADDFINTYGAEFESQIQQITRSGDTVLEVKGEYNKRSLFYTIYFDWGVNHDSARNKVEMVASAFKSRLPKDSADSISIWQWNENTGFYALSFFSQSKTTNEMFEILEPKLVPLLSKIKDADGAALWNPNSMDVKIILDPHKMAKIGILPKHIISSILSNYKSFTGGVVKEGTNNLSIQIESKDSAVESLGQTLIQLGGKSVYLSQIAKIEYGPTLNQSRMFKTNGSQSLILYSKPKGDGNVKQMSDEINHAVQSVISKTNDIQYRVLVDPSSFISSAVENVFHEVAIAAVLAVIVLFLFVGNLKNVLSIGLEIPMSIIVSFIFMKFFGVNLNLISLGGLALAAGMNVDASVVVLENIFRHFKMAEKKETYTGVSLDKIEVISSAVKEVALPIFVSMITTLVVFLPIALTSELTSAILGDLAKAVVLSHFFSAFIAVFIVPSIRYQIMKRSNTISEKSPLGTSLNKLEESYVKFLNKLIVSKKMFYSLVSFLVVFLCVISFYVIPQLPKEIIGTPSSDWVELFVKMSSSEHITQMEEKALEIESTILNKYNNDILYTFVQIHNKSQSSLMFRLKDKSFSEMLMKELEGDYKNTPDLFFEINPWNPASVPIPNPRDLRIELKDNDSKKLRNVAEKIMLIARENKIYDRLTSSPGIEREDGIKITPYQSVWNQISTVSNLTIEDIINLTEVTQGSKRVMNISINERKTPVYLTYGTDYIKSEDELKGFPINIENSIVPLSALGKIERIESERTILRRDGVSMFIVEARKERDMADDYKDLNFRLEDEIKKSDILSREEKEIIEFTDSKKELTDALNQLVSALVISLLLIFIILIMQFQNIISPLIVMMAIPLGLIGAVLSLYLFKSNLSLNSALGIILLNGIAVNNSILLIDFSSNLFKGGADAYSSVIEAARKRLRPILITSLTTILGMAPIALGFGEGGKILQPLGVVVSGGLWFSTVLTLILIPVLQYYYLRSKNIEPNAKAIESETLSYVEEPANQTESEQTIQ